MFKYAEMTFEKGSVLTKEMLGELQAFPRDCLDILYDGYPDGILAGTALDIKHEDSGQEEIFIQKGLFKYKGRIYRMEEDINLTQYIDQWTKEGKIREQATYKLVFVPGKECLSQGRSTLVFHPMELTVCPKSMEMTGIFFARFKILEKGKVTLFDAADMEDISKAVYWNMTQCPYGCRGGITYHPYIFGIIKDVVAAKKRKTSLDYLILNEIISTGIVNTGFLQMILKDKRPEMCLEDRAEVLRQFISVLMEEQEDVRGFDEKSAEDEEQEEYGRMLL